MGTMEKMFSALGTVNHIAVSFDSNLREEARRALDEAEDYVCHADDLLSVFKPDSEVSVINRNAGLCDTRVCADTFELLRRSVELGSMTGGAFDITTMPLTQPGRVKARVDYRDIVLHPEDMSVRLRHKRQAIHLGGIAKGYAVDRVASILKRHSLTCAGINLGGTVRNIGPSRRVGIRNPFDPGKIIAMLGSTEEAVVTSGLYERGSHIFDPAAGKPAQTDVASVTAVGIDGAAADAAATACVVLGIERGIELLDSLGLDGLFVRTNGEILATQGLTSRVQII